MFDRADSMYLQPDERLREVAAILASGVLRLRRLADLRGQATDSRENSAPSCLEVSGETVLSVHTG